MNNRFALLRTRLLIVSWSMIFIVFVFALSAHSQNTQLEWNPEHIGQPLLRDPIWVYNNWSSYDELSDRIPLTEELAMRELSQMVRLQNLGAHFDYYVMDAF